MAIDPALLAWMTSASLSEGIRFDLLTLQTHNNLTLRWTSGDTSVLTTDGRLFSRGPDFERSKVRLAAGLQVSDMDLSIFVDDSVLIGGLPALKFAQRGLLDGATVTLEWAYFDSNGVFKGSFQRFSGISGPAEMELGRIDMTVRNELARLNVMVPRESYQPGCLNQLFDPNCGLNAANFTVARAVTAVPSGRAGFMGFTASGLTQAAGYFDLGVVEFRTGPLASTVHTVRSHGAGGVITVARPWPVLPQVGDSFVVVPGCNRSLARCEGTFNNRGRFRGTPFVPAPETVA